MSSFDRSESAEWAQAVDEMAGKLIVGVDKELASSAARSFPAPPGDTLASILMLGQGAKTDLVAVDGKINDRRRGVLFQQQEFQLNVLIKLAKLALDLYKIELFDALELEQDRLNALKETSRADVERHNSETNLRQKAIIMAHAEMEQRILIYKQQLIKAETTSLSAEAILINATLATATKKLEIIASIYQVLAAEQLVVAAERRRAASLTKVLAAELVVAGVKKEMVPFYIQKASAREALAAAIIAELPITEALIRLGYDRIDLKTTEEYAGHLEREQEEELELLREQFIRANTAMELTRLENHRLLLEYRNAVQAQILEQHKSLQEDEVAFRLASGLAREAIGVNNEVAVIQHEIGNLTQELVNIINNLHVRGQSEAAAVLSGQFRAFISYNTKKWQRKIMEGTFAV